MSRNIGARIKILREQADLRQNQVAAYLGVDQSYLSKLESGERSVAVDQLEKLAELFGCDLDAFEKTDVGISVNSVQIALRARDITVEDMNIIAAVNHIASNSRYMAKLLEENSR